MMKIIRRIVHSEERVDNIQLSTTENFHETNENLERLFESTKHVLPGDLKFLLCVGVLSRLSD